ncbi:hypothetical protein ASZ78_004690 [Callipepla squamata]|uniref:G-protein coupled receptors family 1 profile domain-containing protein n=1 Tax=Callipepla squamata TaxID=9009 RepID=A0A226NJI8_CALSU|nr:hypothetical protein ASZ78_004690 [Callipepla squamata]
MVVALVLLFAISWLPVYLMDIWIDFNIPKSLQDVTPSPWILQLRPFAQWLGLNNSSLNPICYCFVGNLYRSAKEMKTKYHQRMISLFNFSLSEGTTRSSVPELFSYQSPVEPARKGRSATPTMGRRAQGDPGTKNKCGHLKYCQHPPLSTVSSENTSL